MRAESWCVQAPRKRRKYLGLSQNCRKRRNARKEALRVYPEVRETLNAMRAKGCLVVGYTESMAFYTTQRVRSLGLDGVLDYLYCPRDHALPRGLTRREIRRYPDEYYELKHTLQRSTPEGVLKPNKQVLLNIVREIGADPNETIYVGDNLMKDIVMAQAAKIIDVYAKYGIAQDRPGYELLRRVTHWSPSTVEVEKRTRESDVGPSYTLNRNFGELLRLFRFKRFVAPARRKENRIGPKQRLWRLSLGDRPDDREQRTTPAVSKVVRTVLMPWMA